MIKPVYKLYPLSKVTLTDDYLVNAFQKEVKYEIADFLYHMTVLMVEFNVDWEDIVEELANR